jgi:uncharacterized protein YecE (DUF72 family)
VEIRHERFRDQQFVALLRRYDVALVCADTVEWLRLMDLTSDFVYFRLHGSETLYAGGCDAKALDAWAKRVRSWAKAMNRQTRKGLGIGGEKPGRTGCVYVFR